MKTKTKNSARGVFAVSIIMAIVLGTLQQTLVAVPADVQASSDGSSVHHVSPDSSLQDAQSQVSSRRDILIYYLKTQLASLGQVDTNNNTGIVKIAMDSPTSLSFDRGAVSSGTTVLPCIPSEVIDISGSIYESDIQWAIEQCLVQGYENKKFYPDNNLTHEAMIVIAQHAGYTASLMRGANEVVTKSELLKFIDYLQATSQIGLVPSIEFAPIIKRGQYIRLIKLLSTTDTKKPVLAPQHTENLVIPVSTTKPITSLGGQQITVAQFKTILNQSLVTPLPIQAYDDKVILTEDIIKTIINSSQGNALVASVGTNNTGKIDLGINKEILKENLTRIIQKM